MRCRLERDRLEYEALSAIRNGYWNGDFSNLFKNLATDCIIEMNGLFACERGYENVVSRFSKLGDTIKKSEGEIDAKTVEITDINGSLDSDDRSERAEYTGRFGLLAGPHLGAVVDGSMLFVETNDEGKVSRIISREPSLYKYRDYDECIRLAPGYDSGSEYCADYKQSDVVLVGEAYCGEIGMFLACADEEFDEYDDICVMLDVWDDALRYWLDFVDADSFDDAFEKVLGADYETVSVKKAKALKFFNMSGKHIWDNRRLSRYLAERLMEWTDCHRSSNEYIKNV